MHTFYDELYGVWCKARGMCKVIESVHSTYCLIDATYQTVLDTKQITFLQITCVIFWLELAREERAVMYDHVFFEM